MTKKVLLILLCLSTAAFALSPTQRQRVRESMPDVPVCELTAQPQMEVVDSLIATGKAVMAEQARFAIATDLIAAARKHLGARYSLGSTGPKSFDCSGFTSYVFARMGMTLKRSSREQFTQGTMIAEARDLQRGDLVFFGTRSRRGNSGVSHVGIVTEVDAESGSFQFIHSCTSRGVRIDRYPDESFWERRFIAGRRII